MSKSKMTLSSRIYRKVVLAFSISTILSCSSPTDQKKGNTQPVKEYPVIIVKMQSTMLYKDYPAKLQGQQTVEIRSKVTGYIERILVDEGAFVRKGQLLFKINADDIQAMVRSAEAMVKVAEADVNMARVNLEKTQPLVEKKIVSKFDLETAESTLKLKEAQLAQAKANLENARANLRYTSITSPADGTIGIFPFRVGSLVSSSTPEPLTTISNTSKMYAYFSYNEKEFLSMIQGLSGKTLQEKLSRMPLVNLIMADNSIYEKAGKIETASGLVDEQTGSVSVRATFPNETGLLRSGSSGFIRIPQFIDSALVIPQKCSYELQGKHFIYIVGSDNKVHNIEIEIIAGNLKGTYVVTRGLKAGDHIVLEGITGLRNDMEIKPRAVDPGNLSENLAPEASLKSAPVR